LERLQQILSLRQLGFSLEAISTCLDRPGYSPLEVLILHASRLRERITLEQRLCERLEGLVEHFRAAGTVSGEEFLKTIKAMTMIENYYTPEQLEALRQRRQEAAARGEDIAAKGTADWTELLARYTDAMNRGVDPTDPQLLPLERRRRELINAFTGGDPGLENSLNRLWREQGDKLSAQYGYDPKLMEYLGQVQQAFDQSS
jgi:DNA-binding transcriptional MerR regulator